MNYQMVMDELLKITDDEKLYRQYMRVRDDPKRFAEFLDGLDDNDERRQKMKDPSIINFTHNENEFIQSGHHVSLVKHLRFVPPYWHSHDFFELIYVVSGICEHYLKNEDEKRILKKGDIFLLAPGVEHALTAPDENSIVLNLVIRKSTFLEIFLNAVRDKTYISSFFLGNLFEHRNIRYMLYHTGSNENIRNYIFDMYLENIRGDEFSDRIISSMICIFFAQLNRLYKKDVEIPDMEREGIESDVHGLVNYIMNNYQNISLQSLADEFHFSVPYCSKLIKSITGISFSQLLSDIKMQWGENMLLSTQMSIAEISDQVGYENPETFIRVFKKSHGMTPSQYRRSEHHQ